MKKLTLFSALLGLAFTAAAAPAPIVDLKCNAGDFANLQDISASKCPVVVRNSDRMAWSDGPAGKTLEFKGGNTEPKKQPRATVQVTLPATFDATKGFTLLMNFKTPADYQYKRRYQLMHFANGADVVTGFSYFIYWRSIMFRYGTKSRTALSSNKAKMPIRPDTWYETAVTYDGKKLSLYINGELAASADNVVVPMPKMRKLILNVGASTPSGSGYGFDGMISKVQIYDRALTADEIADME